MAEAGRSLGLTEDVATLLTQQTILGAAKLMMQSDDDPAELRRKVCSPGGTTEAAIKHLDAHEVRQHLMQAVHKSAQRAHELGK
ncbi:MAG: pyrroline-5-carboxylate reductase dimerization domain-containing protein, partial [Phycisphaeraceae bacterium]